MTHAASKYWLGQTIYLKHDDDPGIIVGVLFEGDPTHPSTKYVVGWTTAQKSEHHEIELSPEKNYA